MKELDIDAVLKAMEKPAVGNNAESIMQMLAQADQFLKQVEILMQRMDRMGLKPLIVRGLGVKLGVDAESPLKSEKPQFKSETHRKYIESINALSEEELKKLMAGSGGNV
jgi:hypothetical protein